MRSPVGAARKVDDILRPYDNALPVKLQEQICAYCDGEGQVNGATCPECDGECVEYTYRNPMGYFDSYEIGGRYNRLLTGQTVIDTYNADVSDNVCKLSEIPDALKFSAVVSSCYGWWDGKAIVDNHLEMWLRSHPDWYIVAVDCAY